MTAPGPACPVCKGRQVSNHSCGLLVFRHGDGCYLQAGEDATQVADLKRLIDSERGYSRRATLTEQALLSALGYSTPLNLVTVVTPITQVMRRRDFPTAVVRGRRL